MNKNVYSSNFNEKQNITDKRNNMLKVQSILKHVYRSSSHEFTFIINQFIVYIININYIHCTSVHIKLLLLLLILIILLKKSFGT